ncbi:PREDICTED: WW domain-containing oxidoreductase [Ceratosolen solmsi marchali]|uniref:WW domain-containing oxidoreductase n=1 Tax=Ceratosolen solmsi marchali TaxID=326594 RepID=A0AAJ6YY90_9HYME|nr:PREDICTED: WW domain-containing oxidoreductase [Ceratosolen solmsi marchali]XP_011506542.1 PREDICTED: WW domain-containing oxidoreductase [Ceratosolen solmsi marchali]
MVGILNDSDSDDELPPGWEERASHDGNVYYVNHFTKGTQWTHPQTGRKKIVEGELPNGWERCISNGQIFFVDHANRMTTYTDPRLAFATEYRELSQPVRQRFDGTSTALSVLYGRDLRNKVALVTGANTGIGFETARSLALHGCTVVFGCRNMKKAQLAIDKIYHEMENASCDFLHLDLCSLHNIRTAAAKFKQKYRALDILILNAGVFAVPYTLTEDGYEMTFQVNHLSQFYLTLLLEHSLRSCCNARVVILSSESHRFSLIQSIQDLHPLILSPPAYKYWSMGAYNDSKLCNILFAQELARRWPTVSIFSCHPGNMVSSDLSRYSWMYRFLFALVRPFTKSLQQAASTTVFCATAAELESTTGIYFNNCYRCDISNAGLDPQLASRLWDTSQEMIINVVKRDKLWYDLALT